MSTATPSGNERRGEEVKLKEEQGSGSGLLLVSDGHTFTY